jgi:hypothetical protein
VIDVTQAARDLSEWVKPLGYTRQDLPDGFVLSDGETRWYLQQVDGVFLVSTAQRADRPRGKMSSRDFADAERYLTRVFGVPLRQKLLPASAAINIPQEDADVAAGFEVSQVSDDDLGTVISSGGAERARFRSYLDLTDVVQFSHYANASPLALRQSFLDEKGLPVFSTAAHS